TDRRNLMRPRKFGSRVWVHDVAARGVGAVVGVARPGVSRGGRNRLRCPTLPAHGSAAPRFSPMTFRSDGMFALSRVPVFAEIGQLVSGRAIADRSCPAGFVGLT